ncbi:MAG: hypothetical protein R2911_43015 [Caldilineaceae bacterium]
MIWPRPLATARPWPYPMRQWLPTSLFTELLRITQRHQKSQRVDKLVQEMQSFLDSHPVFMHVFAILLKRGDKTGRDTVIDMTRFSEYPPLFALLREYVVSQDGPDESRLSALNVLNEFKQLPSGHVRMWIRGDWQEILALGFEIGDESEVEFPIRSEQARTWLLDATYLMHDREVS